MFFFNHELILVSFLSPCFFWMRFGLPIHLFFPLAGNELYWSMVSGFLASSFSPSLDLVVGPRVFFFGQIWGSADQRFSF